ncbi:hypothetical protein EU527_15945 [Candidatus Thorarchaeota archaeon]|nr:MAG: hypothetical protein EU527_15945 [Candidatus Thorarchaeota archaeon]
MRKNRRRYLLFQLHRENGIINEKDLSMAMWKNLLSLYGEIQAADSRLYLMEFDEVQGLGVIQCTAEALSQVIIASVLIGSINNIGVSFEPKKTSGTMKGLVR